MNPIKLILQIETVEDGKIGCRITDNSGTNYLNYFPVERTIELKNENLLADKIRSNYFQFEKIIRSAINGKIKINQIIHCVFIEDFPFLKDADFFEFIRVDRRNNNLQITLHKTFIDNIYQIYADGSFSSKTGKSGFGVIIQTPNGNSKTFTESFNGGSNNLMELLAVTEGLKQLKSESTIRVNTDSRFVIRGLVQWVHFWRHNNWQTAHGHKVKFASEWVEIDALCENKLIEFKWIKGHSGHEEQCICHNLAKQSAISNYQT